MILPRAFTYLNPALAPTVLVALKPIMSWRELNYKLNLAATSRPSYKARSLVTCVVMRECATNERVVCNWVDLLQVSSVQYMCCEHILTARQQLAANRTSCCSTEGRIAAANRILLSCIPCTLHYTASWVGRYRVYTVFHIHYAVRSSMKKNIQAPISCLFNFGLMSKCLVICSVVPVDLS